MNNVVVAGVGIHPYGRFDLSYRQLGAHAAREALADAATDLANVDMVLVANVNAEMAKGPNIVDLLGRPGTPIIAVENACASSGAALLLASQLIESGAARAILCLGVEKQPRGFIAASGYDAWQLKSGLGVNPVYFALGAQQLLEHTDCTVEDLADLAVKNHRHSVNNVNAMYRNEFTRDEVLNSRMVCPPLTLLMLCAPNEGAAAVVLMSRDEAGRRGVDTGVHLLGVGMATRSPDDFFLPGVAIKPGHTESLTTRAAAIAYEQAGVEPRDLSLVECQDTDCASELIAYRDLGLCKAGDEAALLRSGDTALGGALPVNVSGGLLSKGEPLGASGLGMLHELVQQLRGRSGPRQVEDARLGLFHVMGAGGATSVAIVGK